MNDLISRQAAIDAIEDINPSVAWLNYAVDIIKALPSVQPEQKRGKWIVIMNEPNITFDECKCSECGVVEYFNKGWKKFNYCPNCGAIMDMERE